MGVWSNVYLYQAVEPPSFLERLNGKPITQSSLHYLETIADAIGTAHFSYGDIGKGYYDGFCEDAVLAEVRDAPFTDLVNEFKRNSRSKWVSATFEGADLKWTDQINAAMDENSSVTGNYHVYGVSLVVGQIRIEDEDGVGLFHSNLMLYFYGDSSPNDGRAYADQLIQCGPVQLFIESIAPVAAPSVWKSALVVS